MEGRLRLLLPFIVPCLLSLSAPDSKAGSRIERNIEYARRGERILKADAYLPDGEGPFPGVLMVHGGAWIVGNKRDMSMHARRLVRRGYAVISIEYRLAPKHKFPAQIEDCREALAWMRKNAERFQIDPDRIAGFGYSAGGHLVCLLGLDVANDDERLQAVVAGGAPCDFRAVPESSDMLSYWLGGPRRKLPDIYRDASPSAFATGDAPPVFFYHGERDRMVPNRTAQELYQELKDKGVRADMHTVDGGHIKTFFDEQSVDRAAKFLDDVLKPSRQE